MTMVTYNIAHYYALSKIGDYKGQERLATPLRSPRIPALLASFRFLRTIMCAIGVEAIDARSSGTIFEITILAPALANGQAIERPLPGLTTLPVAASAHTLKQIWRSSSSDCTIAKPIQ
jgi:hypothetical protein